jgi:uncharacterized protein (DUF433 family)
MGNQYVEQREGGYYVSGSRISLDSVVYAFLRGESPEGIVESFPALRSEQAHGAIAFYLAHQQMVDAYLQKGRGGLRADPRRVSPQTSGPLRQAGSGAPFNAEFPRMKPRFLADADFNQKKEHRDDHR